MNEYGVMLEWIESQRLSLTSGAQITDGAEFIYQCAVLALAQGVPFYVAEDPCLMIAQAAAALPREEPFMKDLLPEPWGVLFLEKAIPLPMEDGLTPYIRGLGWLQNHCTVCSHMVLEQIGDFAMIQVDDDDPGAAFCQLKTCDCRQCGAMVTVYGDTPGKGPNGMTMCFTKVMSFHQMQEGQCCDLEDCEERPIFDPIVQFFKATMLFLDQRLVSQEPARADRAARRRYERDHGREPDIRVIYLRKTTRTARAGDAQTGEPLAPVDWSCRWSVGGHWRQQWYAAARVHRRRWIGEYVKGPADKPFRPRGATVYGVVR